jgi:hypothetical protein
VENRERGHIIVNMVRNWQLEKCCFFPSTFQEVLGTSAVPVLGYPRYLRYICTTTHLLMLATLCVLIWWIFLSAYVTSPPVLLLKEAKSNPDIKKKKICVSVSVKGRSNFFIIRISAKINLETHVLVLLSFRVLVLFSLLRSSHA